MDAKHLLKIERGILPFSQWESLVPLEGAYVFCRERKILSFASQDCLGLSQHPELKKSAIRAILQHGIGTTSGSHKKATISFQRTLEEKIAELIGTESALLFPSSLQQNLSLLGAVANSESLILIDEACGPPLMRSAQASKAKTISYRHLDLKHLEELLQTFKNQEYFSKIIITESLFGSEGDLSDLELLSDLALEQDALLYVDESYAMGVKGHLGMGLATHKKNIPFVGGAFTKACGSFGSYLACSHKMKEHLLQDADALESLSLPIAAIGAIEITLDLLSQMEGERKQLEQRAHRLRKQLQDLKLSTGTSCSHLIPLKLKDENEARSIFCALFDAGILVDTLSSTSLGILLGAPHSLDNILTLVHALETGRF